MSDKNNLSSPNDNANNKNNRSPIWTYFEPIDVKNTKCLLCESTYRNSGNTTNLIDHLKRKHRQQYQQVVEIMKNQATANNNNNNNSIKNGDDSEIPCAIEGINQKQEQDSVVEQDHSATAAGGDVDLTQIDTEQAEQIAEGAVVNEEFGEAQDIQVVKIVPLPHARSEVWNYFGFVANDDGTIIDRHKVVCKLCTSTFCYSGNTTNFYSHLKSMHSEIQMRSMPSKSSQNTPNAKHGATKRSYSTMVSQDVDGSDLDVTQPDNETRTSNASYYHHSNNASTNNNQSIMEHNHQMDDPLPERSLESIIYVDDITQCLVDFLVTDCRPLCLVQGRGFQRFLRLLAPGYVLPDKQKLSIALRKRYDELKRERLDPTSGAMDRFNHLM